MNLEPNYEKPKIFMPRLACYIFLFVLIVFCILTAVTLGLLPVYLSRPTTLKPTTAPSNVKISLKSKYLKKFTCSEKSNQSSYYQVFSSNLSLNGLFLLKVLNNQESLDLLQTLDPLKAARTTAESFALQFTLNVKINFYCNFSSNSFITEFIFSDENFFERNIWIVVF